MNIGILDTKVGGAFIENVERYEELGYDVINATALDRPTKNYDILAVTWTQLSARRLANVCCKAVVVKDNDEPYNCIQKATVEQQQIKLQLTGLWGVNTRVLWNLKQIELYAPEVESVLMVAETAYHDALAEKFTAAGISWECHTPKDFTARERIKYDVVIIHLSKADYTKYWFDQYLMNGIAEQLLISTTRGPIFSAKTLNLAIMNHTPQTAVLDWAWEQDQIASLAIREKRVILTNHTSYQSEESRRELTEAVIEGVEKLREQLSPAAFTIKA